MASDNVPSLDSLKDVISDISQSTASIAPTVQKYNLGDFELQSGEILPQAEIAYKIYGSDDLPVILYPTWFSGGKYHPFTSTLFHYHPHH